ncbi:MAG: SMP-30/gluconolactonase/LRE family protein [Janthinobacterium lividum]
MTWTPLEDSRSQLGESPFWHPHESALYWLDIKERTVLRKRIDGTGLDSAAPVERWRLPSEPGCMAPARRGGLVLALRDGIYRAHEWGGALSLLAPAAHDTRTMRFNDGKCDARGRFWAGNLNETKDRPNATLYCLDARDTRGGRTPTFACMANEATTANGLAFSPDTRTLYWADTAAAAVRAWDWSADENTLTRPRTFKAFDAKPDDWTSSSSLSYGGRPDGATVDAQGDYWVAMYEGARLLRFAASGEQVAALPVPVQCPTMPCFGGEDLRTLFVTTAGEKRPEAEVARMPASGCVLAMRVDAPGLPVCFFED